MKKILVSDLNTGNVFLWPIGIAWTYKYEKNLIKSGFVILDRFEIK